MNNSQQVSRANHIMKRSFQPTMAALLSAVTMTLTPGIASAAVMEFGDLNFIQDGGNPSNGLRFLDMTFSDALTQPAALANAQATYPDARLATAAEWDHLFAAAGISYDGALTASDVFTTGATEDPISSTTNYDGGILAAKLGATSAAGTFIWSDPDGSEDIAGTRDTMSLYNDKVVIHQAPFYGFGSPTTPYHSSIGWMIVSDAAAIPEPSTALLLCLGLLALATGRWNR